MDSLDDIEKRARQLVSELADIIQNLGNDISNSTKSNTFNQIKEIEKAIDRIKKQGLSVPDELTKVKIKLICDYESHQKKTNIYQNILLKINEIQNKSRTSGPKGP